MPEPIVIEFSDSEMKNHSIRWNANDKDAAVSSVYIRKPVFQNAHKIRVTIEEVQG
jgi:hypothetical protein